MDPEITHFVIMAFCALFLCIVFATGTSWVHQEYYRRYKECRAPRWLYWLEYARSVVGRDAAEGRPDPPKPNAK